MGDDGEKRTLRGYLKRLDEQSRPNSNDRRYAQYARYASDMVRHFIGEEAVLAGSTAENLKLRSSKDGGDADFLLVSGKLVVLVSQLEFRDDNPCFVRVRLGGSELGPSVPLIDGRYLPGDVLRRVDPQLFSMLRGIYLMVTCSTQYVPGRNTEVTTTGEESKVGLQRMEYRDLRVEGQILKPRRQYNKEKLLKRNKAFKKYLNKRRQEVPNNRRDIEGIETMLTLIAGSKEPGLTGEHGGQWQHFAHVVKLVLQRRKEDYTEQLDDVTLADDDNEGTTVENDLDSDQATMTMLYERSGEQSHSGVKRKHSQDDTDCHFVKASCLEKSSKDFVPAVRTKGPLPFMSEWRKREHRWLTASDVDDICQMEVFLVARYAPVNPSSKDFCLSFTRAEKNLSQCLSPAQRTVLIIMKAYLKGVISERHRAEDRDLKLKTFHLKTAMYRVSDVTDPAVWSEDAILAGVRVVIEYLGNALHEEQLLHYFVPSNLFDGFEKGDFAFLQECLAVIVADPVGSIKPFFDLDDGGRLEVQLTEEEALCVEKVSEDGGRAEEMDRLEEAVLELQRAFSEGPKDAHGNAPIADAIASLSVLLTENRVPPEVGAALQPVVAGVLGHVMANPEAQAMVGSLMQLFGGDSSSRSRADRRRLQGEAQYNLTKFFMGKKE